MLLLTHLPCGHRPGTIPAADRRAVQVHQHVCQTSRDHTAIAEAAAPIRDAGREGVSRGRLHRLPPSGCAARSRRHTWAVDQPPGALSGRTARRGSQPASNAAAHPRSCRSEDEEEKVGSFACVRVFL